MVFARSFTDDSWWNRPIPSTVPVDPRSAAMTSAQGQSCPPPKVGSPFGAWAMPWSEAATLSKTAKIRDASGATVQISVDTNIGEMSGNDAAVVWRDLKRGIEVATFETDVPRKRDGTIDLTKPIVCTAFSIYGTGTNGLSRQVGGAKQNSGHRGVPPSASALHPAEALGPIAHRLKCALGQPGDHPGPNFPMYGIESPRGGAIPEGAVIRLRNPKAGNVIQQAAHAYGFIVGDTGATGTATIKTVQGGVYSAAVLDSLKGTSWPDWDVMLLGWH